MPTTSSTLNLRDSTSGTVFFAGGGTGGHLFPGIAIAEQIALQAIAQGRTPPRCIFLCSTRPIDASILTDERVEFVPINAKPFSLRPRAALAFALSWKPTVDHCMTMMREAMQAPTTPGVAVVAMGGFIAAPGARAAERLRLPLTLVNLDAAPGLANRGIARLRPTIFTTAQLSGSQFARWTRIPPIVRRAALAPADRAGCRAQLGLDPERPVLVVTGASQGARSINRFMLSLVHANANLLRKDGWQIFHQTGNEGADEALNAYGKERIPAVVKPFMQAMGTAWGAADLAISRCGAGSVAEVWANAVPTVFMPYPYHKDEHQRKNAEVLVRAGAARLARDHIEPTPNMAEAGEMVKELLMSPGTRDTMRAAFANLGPADGAATVARAVWRDGRPANAER